MGADEEVAKEAEEDSKNGATPSSPDHSSDEQVHSEEEEDNSVQ